MFAGLGHFLKGLEFDCSGKLALKQLRINEAKKKLCNTEASIGQIAKEVGFLNQFNFTRSFKNSLELSPENYRKIYKNK
ncbi:helix-turn-helix domain-containing protein [Lactobacillus delbrueckii]|uniref:helix-turn-helix domain-containing protein n=1 Tax=Lactobacillus delbrueckii TaxID=1584 RepID=UPI00240E16A3|nr:AraC family transcriptional regulator [Lactobacillus delbrueckii]